jgi:hypothetical protein
VHKVFPGQLVLLTDLLVLKAVSVLPVHKALKALKAIRV